MVDKVREAIDLLTSEVGTKTGNFWTASFSVKDVLEKAGMLNTSANQRYVIHTVRKWYSGSKVSPGQHDNGGILQMRIRSI